MRKKSIIKEYNEYATPGIYNMQEKSNLLSGKMMNIPNSVRISYNFTSADIGDLTSSDSTKLALAQNTIASLHNVSNSYVKENAILSLTLDSKQSAADANTLSNWIFEFNANYLLREYLYAKIYSLNPHSPFKEIDKSYLPNNKINQLVYDYINFNILNRYQLTDFILWTSYFPLNYNTVPGTGTDPILNPTINLLKQSPVYSFHAIPTVFATGSTADSLKETVSTKPYTDGVYDIYYKQTKSSQYYTFIYYYDAIFTRI